MISLLKMTPLELHPPLSSPPVLMKGKIADRALTTTVKFLRQNRRSPGWEGFMTKSDILPSVDAEGHEYCRSSAALASHRNGRLVLSVPPLAEFFHGRMLV